MYGTSIQCSLQMVFISVMPLINRLLRLFIGREGVIQVFDLIDINKCEPDDELFNVSEFSSVEKAKPGSLLFVQYEK